MIQTNLHITSRARLHRCRGNIWRGYLNAMQTNRTTLLGYARHIRATACSTSRTHSRLTLLEGGRRREGGEFFSATSPLHTTLILSFACCFLLTICATLFFGGGVGGVRFASIYRQRHGRRLWMSFSRTSRNGTRTKSDGVKRYVRLVLS